MTPLDRPPLKNRILSSLWVCLGSCGLTLLLLAVVYALRGIWPFGTENVAYVDTAQFYLPDYYGIWDALHGANRNINWFSGLIEAGIASASSFLRPANWAFLLVSRDHVLEGLSRLVRLPGVELTSLARANDMSCIIDSRWPVEAL